MEGDVISLQDIFVFQQDGVRPDGRVAGRFRATGVRPRCSERLSAAGIQLSTALFEHLELVA
jgi:pilus assembly protein CpaF